MREMKEETYNALKNRNMTGAARFNHEIEIEGFVPSGGGTTEDPPGGGTTEDPPGGEFAGGSGTPEAPYLVATCSQLDNVRNHPSASFKQIKDIDLAACTENWMPIFGFSGNYDGQGFTIFNLKMNHKPTSLKWDDPLSRVGLFRDTNAASLSNIHLSNVDIEANQVVYVGSLVGYSDFTNITNCSSSGNIKILGDRGAGIGGLIGVASNDSGNPDITIMGCHSAVNISGILRPPEVKDVTLKSSGGFVGMTEGGGVVIFECCFATGNVKLMPYDYNDLSLYGWGEALGGFVGFTNGAPKFRKCYATGNVRGVYSSGGFVGQEYYGAEFENCYARGSVEFAPEWMNYRILVGRPSGNKESDFSGFGGFSGDTYSDATATNCYSAGGVPIGDFYDTAGFRTYGSGTAGCYYDSTNAPVPDSFAIGKTTSEMKTESTFAGWDFENIWGIDPDINEGYPYLRCTEQAGMFSGGDGSSSNPYLIANADDLDNVRNNMSAHYKQIANVDLSVFINWAPIGPWTNPFTGTYDGDGFEIQNLRCVYYDSEVKDGLGLFGTTEEGATLKNIKLRDIHIEIIDGGTRLSMANTIGGLVSYCYETSVINCSTTGEIILPPAYSIGGMFGEFRGGPGSQVSNCWSSVNIEILSKTDPNGTYNDHFQIGGFAGLIEGSSEIEEFSKEDFYLGLYPIDVLCCHASGDIIISYSNEVEYITTSYAIGGFAGTSTDCVISQCYATGGVDGIYERAGFIGNSWTDVIVDCYSTGSLTSGVLNMAHVIGESNGIEDVAGFVGYTSKKYPTNFVNCYTTTAETGGLFDASGAVGYAFVAKDDPYDYQANCYYNSDIQNWEDVVATGKSTTEMKTQSTYAGWDFDAIWKIDPAVNDGYPHLRCGEEPGEEPEPPQVANHIFKARSISISKSNAGASTATIVVDNKDGIVNPRNPYGLLYGILNLNKKISIKQGYGDDLIPSFTGIIDSIEMSTWPQVASIQLRDNLKRALDQTVTKDGKNVVAYTKQPIEDIVTDLCRLCGLDIGTVDETGISIETEFNWQTYGDAFQNLADLASFEFFVDEAGLFYFRRDYQPNDMEVAWSFEEGVDITDMSYTLDDNDLYHAVRVYGKDESDNVLVYNALFVDAPEFNILPQKVLKIDATEATTVNELAKIAQRALATMRSRSRVISFSTVAIPHLQKGDFIQIFESSTNTHEIYRLSSIALRMDSKSFTMQCQAYYYGDSIVLGEIPGDIAFQVPDANLNLIPQMTSNTKPYGVARSSSVYKLYGITYNPWRSFNDAELDYFWDISTVQGWIEYEFPLRHIIDKYSVKGREDLVWNKAIPKDWAFEAFDGEKWIELDRQTGHTNWGIYEERSFNFDNTTPYAKYRLRVIANNGYKRSQVEQLKMFYRGGV